MNQLESLKISDSEISDCKLCETFRACSRLKKLTIINCPKFRGVALAHLATTQLTALKIKTKFYESCCFASFSDLVSRNLSIQLIKLQSVRFDFPHMRSLNKAINNMVIANLNELYIRDFDLEYIKHLIIGAKNVKVLHLCFCYEYDSSPPILQNGLPFLREIHLYNAPNNDLSIQSLISKSPNLEKIYINGEHYKYGAFDGAELKNLRILDLEHWEEKNVININLDQWGDLLRRAPLLEKLTMIGVDDSHAVFGDLTGTLQNLTEISVATGIDLDDEQLKQLTMRSNNLENVEIFYQSKITDQAVMDLVKRCKKIKDLEITDCKKLKKDKLDLIHIYGKSLYGSKFRFCGM